MRGESRVQVCGDRNWTNEELISDVLSEWDGLPITIVHGAAPGADTIGAKIAGQKGFAIESYPAEWAKYGKAAGPIRNQQMLDSGVDLVLAFHSDIFNSKGTKHMVSIANRAGVPVHLYGEK